MIIEILTIGLWLLIIAAIMVLMSIALFFIAAWIESVSDTEDDDEYVDHELIRRIQEQIKEEDDQIFINP